MQAKKYAVGLMAVVAMMTMASTVKAVVIDLTFEGLKDEEPINDFYNGGTGGFGSGPGPNYGISFTPDSLAIISEYNGNGGSGNFENNPSGNTIAFFLNGSGDTMNVAGGFTTGFSFFYSAIVYPGSVNVYSGLNGTGSLLATLNLAVTPSFAGSVYDNWAAQGVTFAGTAESVVFTGTANYIGFDDITLGSATPATVPDSAGSSAELLAGLGMLGAALLLRRKATVTV